MNPSRRTFLGFLAPLAVLPVVGPSMLLSERPKVSGWTAKSLERVTAYNYELYARKTGWRFIATNHTFEMYREAVRAFVAAHGPASINYHTSRTVFRDPQLIWCGEHHAFHQDPPPTWALTTWPQAIGYNGLSGAL